MNKYRWYVPSEPVDLSERLSALKAETLRRSAGLAGSFEDIVEATRDVATDDEHDPEGHTIAWERQQLAALLADARSGLAEIEAAELRLEAGHYGTCTSCSQEITAERLEALPATPTCVSCSSKPLPAHNTKHD